MSRPGPPGRRIRAACLEGPSRFRARKRSFMLRIALPNKGRLAEDVRGVFSDAGLEIRANGERALTASLGRRVRGHLRPQPGHPRAGVRRRRRRRRHRLGPGLRGRTAGGRAAGPRVRPLPAGARGARGLAASSGPSSCPRALAPPPSFPASPGRSSPRRASPSRSSRSPARPRSHPPRHRGRGGRPDQHREHAPDQRTPGGLHPPRVDRTAHRPAGPRRPTGRAPWVSSRTRWPRSCAPAASATSWPTCRASGSRRCARCSRA